MESLRIVFAVWVLTVPVCAQELVEIVAPDAAGKDFFGQSVSIADNTIVVGASYDDDVGANSGSAYVFVGAAANWAQQAKLTASDGFNADSFGSAVAVSGDTVVIGACRDDHVNLSAKDEGSVYVFVRNGATWTQQAKLIASDSDVRDFFGMAVAIDLDTLVVGVARDDDMGSQSGSAYIFRRSGTIWTQEAKLIAGDGAADDLFGTSVSLTGSTLVIGAPHNIQAGVKSGSAYVFIRNGTAWSLQAKLTSSDAADNDSFGRSVSVIGDTLAIGADENDDSGIDSGSAYVFTRSGSVWSERAKLIAADANAFQVFGRAVSVTHGAIVVGACDDSGKSAGAAYLFAGSGSNWAQVSKFEPNEASPTDFFGATISVSGSTAVIGSGWDDDAGTDSGSCHVFSAAAVTTYCTAGTTTNSCAATVAAAGTPSVGATSGFMISVTNVEGQKQGLIFYGLSGRAANAWWPGSTSLLCVKQPTQRSLVQNSGGTVGMCDGVFMLDFNAYRAANPGALGQPMAAGLVIDSQAWFRDPPAPKTTNLSNALEFVLIP